MTDPTSAHRAPRRGPHRGPRRATAVLAAAVAATATLTLSSLTDPTSAGTAPAAAVAKPHKPTKFLYRAWAYGSRIKGGQLPVRSDATAFESFGCTNRAGIDRSNHAAQSQVQEIAVTKGIRTRTWSELKNGVASSNAVNHIADVRASEPEVGQLSIDRLRSYSRAFHDKTGFHAATEVTVGDITFRGSDGKTQDLDPPTVSQPVTIPGVLKITIGDARRRVTASGASATADGLTVHFLPTDTRVVLGHSTARISRGVKIGTFHGRSFGTETRAEDPLLSAGRQPLLKMPCQGTGGRVVRKSTAAVGDDSSLGAHEVTTRQMARATTSVATGFEEAAVSSVSLGGGQLTLTGIVGRVNVTRTKAGVVADTKGTTIGSVKLGGLSLPLPDLDGFTIPGLVRVDTHLTTKLRNGIEVVAVRLTFLDGSGRVTDLGYARLQVNGTGLK